MELFASTKIFDIKTLLLLREETKNKLSVQEGYPIRKLNSSFLNLLAENIVEIAKKDGINRVAERTLRLYLADNISEELELPRIKSGKSILDLVCMYLGYSNLAEYQKVKTREIEGIKYQIKKLYALAELENNQTNNHVPHLEYFAGYYYAYFGYVHPAVIVLNHQTGIMELHLSKIEPYSEGFLYLGPFEISKEGYLTYFGTLQNFDRSVTICVRVYYDDVRKNYKYHVGTYVGTSLQDYDNIAGINLFEKANSLEDAKEKGSHIDERIIKYLDGTRVETKRKGFYSLDELLASK